MLWWSAPTEIVTPGASHARMSHQSRASRQRSHPSQKSVGNSGEFVLKHDVYLHYTAHDPGLRNSLCEEWTHTTLRQRPS